MFNQLGRYQLVRELAAGGMAKIYLAKTTGIAGFEKLVALKMIHSDLARNERFVHMLIDEAKIAVQLDHRNIVQTFDLGRFGDRFYITMEYVDGTDLYRMLCRAAEREIAMPFEIAAYIAREIANALAHAHAKADLQGRPLGIVHRDVSPQNVLVSYGADVKLADFGIAKAATKASRTAIGTVQGKYSYMSPEQAAAAPVDHRSDIFSAGIVLYEMLTGQMLYRDEDLLELVRIAREAEIPAPSTLRTDTPPQLEHIVMRALAKHPDDRYQTAGALAADLEAFMDAYAPSFSPRELASFVRRIAAEPLWSDAESTQYDIDLVATGDPDAPTLPRTPLPPFAITSSAIAIPLPAPVACEIDRYRPIHRPWWMLAAMGMLAFVLAVGIAYS